MNREIKFRGKLLNKESEKHLGRAVENGWVYGSLNLTGYYKDDDCKIPQAFIIENICPGEQAEVEVDIRTVGQYTGLEESRNLIGEYDKKEIFEGDIIQKDGWDDLYLVEFEDCKFVANKIHKPTRDFFTRHDEDLDCFLWPIVVGNKFDNPELLERRQQN